jgi:hypothetical protein
LVGEAIASLSAGSASRAPTMLATALKVTFPICASASYRGSDCRETDPRRGGSAILGPSWRRGKSVAEETRTRGFAPPAFAGFAFVDRGGG